MKSKKKSHTAQNNDAAEWVNTLAKVEAKIRTKEQEHIEKLNSVQVCPFPPSPSSPTTSTLFKTIEPWLKAWVHLTPFSTLVYYAHSSLNFCFSMPYFQLPPLLFPL